MLVAFQVREDGVNQVAKESDIARPSVHDKVLELVKTIMHWLMCVLGVKEKQMRRFLSHLP